MAQETYEPGMSVSLVARCNQLVRTGRGEPSSSVRPWAAMLESAPECRLVTSSVEMLCLYSVIISTLCEPTVQGVAVAGSASSSAIAGCMRLCRTCRHAGCCDDSNNRHAAEYFHTTQHPIMTSIEPSEHWSWRYIDELVMELPS